MSAPDESFFCIADGGALLEAAFDRHTANVEPVGPALAPGLSRWDEIRNGKSLAFNQSDCNWFAFEAKDVANVRRSVAGIVALHRTGSRLARLELGSRAFDRRPLFLTALYELDDDHEESTSREVAVDGAMDEGRFSFVARDRRWQLLQAPAAEWRASLPPVLRAFFSADTPAFAVRSQMDDFELELFMRPLKDPVVYGDAQSAVLPGERAAIHYVQRPRLDVVGAVRRRERLEWAPPRVIRGSATQDRHWMTVTELGLRWTWFMARLDDGRECMAYQLRTADGGRNAPTDSGRVTGGGAWVVEPDGSVRKAQRWTFAVDASCDARTSRGRVPTRLLVELPEEDLRFVVAPRVLRFVPTRALGELVEAGIWESPARLVEGTTEGEFWLDYMPPFGGV